MYSSKPHIIYVVLALFLSITGFWGWYSFSGSIPDNLTKHEGSIVYSEALTTKYSHSVKFALNKKSNDFLYPSILPNSKGVKLKLDTSKHVVLLADKKDVWYLEIDGKNALTKQESLSARTSNSQIALWLGIVSLFITMYVLNRRKSRNPYA